MTTLQYVFKCVSLKTGGIYQKFSTAHNAEEALLAVKNDMGSGFDVQEKPIAVYPAHEFYNEVDCV